MISQIKIIKDKPIIGATTRKIFSRRALFKTAGEITGAAFFAGVAAGEAAAGALDWLDALLIELELVGT